MKKFWQQLKKFFSDAEKVALATVLIDFFVAVVTAIQLFM
jgi:hypothetical protein